MSDDIEFDLDLTDAGMYGFRGLTAAARASESTKYFLDDSLLGPYSRQLQAQVADLVDIASAISWADRKYRRTRSYGVFGNSLGWMRTFHIKLGVREPDLWNSTPVKSFLESYLRWHTEDTWDLQFVRLGGIRRPSDVAVQTALFKAPPENATVVLFSGGLDSLAGTADMLQTKRDRTLFLLSAVHSRLSGVTSMRSGAAILASIVGGGCPWCRGTRALVGGEPAFPGARQCAPRDAALCNRRRTLQLPD
jgi:hypothetical protein